jgi:predicted secreted protein
LARINGRIKSTDAPVVPMMLASTAPINNINALKYVVPTKVPRIIIPPEIVNSPHKRTINGM